MSHGSVGSLCAKGSAQAAAQLSQGTRAKAGAAPPQAAPHSSHLSKHPERDSHSVQVQQTRGSTGKQTPDGMEEQGEEEEEKALRSADSTKAL